ncbi:MAG: hypothetical protein ACI4XL_05290 [Bacillus sp. (in: firmicutes)]
MRVFLNILFVVGAIGTIGKYIGIDFFKEYSVWFLVLFVGGGLGRMILANKEVKLGS